MTSKQIEKEAKKLNDYVYFHPGTETGSEEYFKRKQFSPKERLRILEASVLSLTRFLQ